MTKQDFYKVWKDSTKEDILNQYYYDYEYLTELKQDIKKAITFCEDRSLWYINCQYTKLNLHCVINTLSDIVDILKRSDENE